MTEKQILAPSVQSRAGRKPKDQLDRLIPKVWYCAVVSRVFWPDARLDVEFIPGLDGEKHVSATRVRAFERIRKHGVFPASKDREPLSLDKRIPRQRYFDLVKVIDERPEFNGTAKVITSPFWKLLKVLPGDLTAAVALVDESLALLGLKRLPDEEALIVRASCARDASGKSRGGLREGFVSDFEVMLQRATQHLPIDLDLLALFGAMYREACLCFRPADAEVLGHYFNISLMDLCEQDWIRPVRSEVEDIARHRVLYGVGDYLPGTGSAAESRLACAYAIG